MKRLVVGILAHVDSGKTTLSEGLLYSCGVIKKMGRVDHKDAFLDTEQLERERGITIFSKQAVLHSKDMEITLLDTPGHVDFSPEMERVLQILDYAILVISGTDGVQSHTETLWHLLKLHHIPTFVFVNKMDLNPSNKKVLMEELKQRLDEGFVEFDQDQTDLFLENIALCQEGLLEEYLDTGTLKDESIVSSILECKVFPCYFGSALKLKGVYEILEGLENYTKAPEVTEEFGAKVYKIARDDQGNRLTYLKITGGSLRVKNLLAHVHKGEEDLFEKVNQIRLYSGEKYQAIEEALPGMVCAVTGLFESYPGEGFGKERDAMVPILEPVLTYRVELAPENDVHSALLNLRTLEEEEPELHVIWNEINQEIQIQIMGEVQMEVLKSLVMERFQMDVNFGKGQILYKETIEDIVEGVGHYEPLRHYAEVHLLLEPAERGSGLVFSSACSVDELDKNWQHLVISNLEEKNHLGVLTGSEITDMRITLIAGRAHVKHTEGGDFRQAACRAVRQGLKEAKSVLLEPWYDFRLEVPAESVGRAMSDLQRMHGQFEPPEIQGERAILTGSVPVVDMQEYQLTVTDYTKGRGRLSVAFHGYEPCHNTEEVMNSIAYDSDGDLDNSADSVFCSHGVGLLVKWDHVKEQMHLESAIPKQDYNEQEKMELQEPIMRRAAVYCASLAEDKELSEIFERTYGPIRQNLRNQPAFQPRPETERPFAGFHRADPGPEYLLVDGYNIIFSWDELRELAKDNLDAARERLVHILCNYRGVHPCELILVFDAYKVKGSPGTMEKVHNISVVYTKEAETADTYIEKVAHDLGKSFRVRVATSDGLEQMIILNRGALRVPAREFYEEIKQADEAIRSYLAQ